MSAAVQAIPGLTESPRTRNRLWPPGVIAARVTAPAGPLAAACRQSGRGRERPLQYPPGLWQGEPARGPVLPRTGGGLPASPRRLRGGHLGTPGSPCAGSPEQTGRFTRADELRAADQIGSRRNRGLFDIFQAESVVSAGRGFSRHEGSPRNCAENSRLAHAQALGRLPRTDQSVQVVCRTNAAL